MTWQHKLLYHASVGSRLSELNTCAVKLQNNAACSPVDRSCNTSRRNTSRGTNMTYPENKTSVFRISGHEGRTRSVPSSEDPCYPVGSKPPSPDEQQTKGPHTCHQHNINNIEYRQTTADKKRVLGCSSRTRSSFRARCAGKSVEHHYLPFFLYYFRVRYRLFFRTGQVVLEPKPLPEPSRHGNSKT